MGPNPRKPKEEIKEEEIKINTEDIIGYIRKYLKEYNDEYKKKDIIYKWGDEIPQTHIIITSILYTICYYWAKDLLKDIIKNISFKKKNKTILNKIIDDYKKYELFNNDERKIIDNVDYNDLYMNNEKSPKLYELIKILLNKIKNNVIVNEYDVNKTKENKFNKILLNKISDYLLNNYINPFFNSKKEPKEEIKEQPKEEPKEEPKEQPKEEIKEEKKEDEDEIIKLIGKSILEFNKYIKEFNNLKKENYEYRNENYMNYYKNFGENNNYFIIDYLIYLIYSYKLDYKIKYELNSNKKSFKKLTIIKKDLEYILNKNILKKIKKNEIKNNNDFWDEVFNKLKYYIDNLSNNIDDKNNYYKLYNYLLNYKQEKKEGDGLNKDIKKIGCGLNELIEKEYLIKKDGDKIKDIDLIKYYNKFYKTRKNKRSLNKILNNEYKYEGGYIYGLQFNKPYTGINLKAFDTFKNLK